LKKNIFTHLYKAMKTLRESFVILIISILLFGLLEFFAYYKLCDLGYDPFDKDQRYQYGREASCYAVSDNKKNYRFSAHDSLNNLAELKIDEHGFVLGASPLTRYKPDDEIRIFVLGGSTAFGSGQTDEFQSIHPYPTSNFDYHSSISGQLYKILQNNFPHKSVVVVNGAIVAHGMHQNLARYYEKIHDFHPDIIVNIDGRNDNVVFSETDTSDGYIPGELYGAAKGEFESLLALEVIAKTRQWPFTINLINHYIDLKTKHVGEENVRHLNSRGTFSSKEPTNELYKVIEPQLIANAQKFLWVVQAYQHQLRLDNVYSLFVLQPLLSERNYQKNLSPTELKLRNKLEELPLMDSIDYEQALSQSLKKSPESAYNNLRQMINNKTHPSAVRDGFFYNQYLAHVIDSISNNNGHGFIHFGKELKGMEADKEFYTDYCHLTAYGNWYMARIIAEKLDPVIKKLNHKPNS